MIFHSKFRLTQSLRFLNRYESGNTMKDLLGGGNLKWNTNKLQGAYKGKCYDFNDRKVQAAHDACAGSGQIPQASQPAVISTRPW